MFVYSVPNGLFLCRLTDAAVADKLVCIIATTFFHSIHFLVSLCVCATINEIGISRKSVKKTSANLHTHTHIWKFTLHSIKINQGKNMWFVKRNCYTYGGYFLPRKKTQTVAAQSFHYHLREC